MLIGYVLVIIFNGSMIEPVNDNVLTWDECQASLKVEQVYHPLITNMVAQMFTATKKPRSKPGLFIRKYFRILVFQ